MTTPPDLRGAPRRDLVALLVETLYGRLVAQPDAPGARPEPRPARERKARHEPRVEGA